MAPTQAAQPGLITRLLDTAVAVFGKEAIHEAWDEFMLWDEAAPGLDPESPHASVFWPWFYYDWRPDPDDTAVTPGAPMHLTVAGAYLEKHGTRLDPLARDYLLACQTAPFSFHEVVSCNPGRGFVLRDILTGDECAVTERMGSEHARVGDVLFAKVVALDGIAELDGCSPVLIPPVHKTPILALRKKIGSGKRQITRERLKDYDLEMVEVYHQLVEPLLNPSLPKLANTDGDPMVFHKLIYDIRSPQAVFDALKSLALGAPDAELLSEAEYDAHGALRKIEFSWLKPNKKRNTILDNTVLAQIHIEANQLVVDVNSGQRAEKFQTLATKLLGDTARYRTTVIESPQAMLRHGAPEMSAAKRAAQEALDADPQVQAEIARLLAAHYQNWLDEIIPALGNQTPRQAVKTRDGREMVEALLTQLERDMHEQEVPGRETLIQDLRRRLSLD